jgi:putative transposase
MEGATENAKVVQALLDNLIDRHLDPNICRLFVVDGAKALSKAIRRTFGADIPIQRCQVHYADPRIMPTSATEKPSMAIIAVKSAA